MPMVYPRRVRRVVHIGHLDPADAINRPSPDGFGIAVSTNPESWRQIHGLNGPEHILDFSAAEWLDVFSWEDSDIRELIAWSVAREYLRKVTVWRVQRYDEASDAFIETTDVSFAEAVSRIGRTEAQELEAQATGQGAVEEGEGYRLTKLAVRRLGGSQRWPDPLIWYEGAVLLYARDVVLRKRPYVVGIWWQEPHEPAAGLSDYGVLFPERLHLFNLIDEDGESQPFSEVRPDIVASHPDRLVDYD